eukprot:515771-Rhodomonas_salina.1
MSWPVPNGVQTFDSTSNLRCIGCEQHVGLIACKPRNYPGTRSTRVPGYRYPASNTISIDTPSTQYHRYPGTNSNAMHVRTSVGLYPGTRYLGTGYPGLPVYPG